MLPRRHATSALLCALSSLLARGVRGADLRIPVPTHRQPTTDNSHAALANNVTALKGSEPSSTSAPDQRVSSLYNQASAFSGTEREQPDRFDVTPSLLDVIATEISTSPYTSSSSFGATTESLETSTQGLPTETYEQPHIDDRPTLVYGTATVATELSTEHYELSSSISTKRTSVPETQFTELPGTQSELSTVVGFEESSPESQATERHSSQYQQSESMEVSVLSLETHISTEKYELRTSVAHTASTSATHTTEFQTEIGTLAADLDEVSLSMQNQKELLTTLHHDSYDVSATTLPVETRGPELSTNLDKKNFFADVETTLSFSTSNSATESATDRYSLLPGVSAGTASLLEALATESRITHQELSSSVGLSTSLHTIEQYQPPDGINVMSLSLETGAIELSTEQYVLPSHSSEATSTSTTPTTETSEYSEHSYNLELSGLFRETQATVFSIKQDDNSSIHRSTLPINRAPAKELSTSTAALTAMFMQASDKSVTVIAAVMGSVVLLAIVCGGLLVLAYRAGKTGSFWLPKMHSSGTDIEMKDPTLHMDSNHASTRPANGCENAAFA